MTIANNSNLTLKQFTKIGLPLLMIAYLYHAFEIESQLELSIAIPVFILAGLVNAVLPFQLRSVWLLIIGFASTLYFFGLLSTFIITVHILVFLLIIDKVANNLLRYIGIAIFLLYLILSQLDIITWMDHKKSLAVIGVLLMFRIIILLRDKPSIEKSKEFLTVWNYTFMMPNIINYLFPIIDLKLFSDSYYNTNADKIYQNGLIKLTNGILHLLLYRIIYIYFLPSPSTVVDLSSLSIFIISTYLLIVRLAGLFHVSIGILNIFGYNLPAPFHHYFLANSFSDIWRRINIYWRDFITKYFYIPIYFKLKRKNLPHAMIVAIIIVFILNWFLHSWQWFWLKGQFPLTFQDAIFWMIFGFGVALTVFIQTHYRTNKINIKSGFLNASIDAFKILLMFITMAILWSFWTSDSIPHWRKMISTALHSEHNTMESLVNIGSIVFAIFIVLAYFIHQYKKHTNTDNWIDQHKYSFSMFSIIILFLFSIESIHSPMLHTLGLEKSSIFTTQLNARDKERQFKGYYEDILIGNNIMTPLQDLEIMKQRDQDQLGFSGLGIRREDIMLKELAPNYQITFKGADFKTNNLGIRDKEYETIVPDNTMRIALLGGSIELGVGISNSDTYENIAENILENKKPFGKQSKIEILNYGISGNHLYQQIAMLELKVPDANPDVIIYTAHPNETHRSLFSIYKTIATGRDIRYEYLKFLKDKLDISAAMTEDEFMKTIAPYNDSIVDYGYQLIIEFSKSINAVPVWMAVPTLDDIEIPGEIDRLEKKAKDAGFITIRIDDAYAGHISKSLYITPYDTHPNVKGHQLLGHKMAERIMNDPNLRKKISELLSEKQ